MKDIIINDNCYETCPCRHKVVILYNDSSYKVTELDGISIYEILDYLDKEIPEHFRNYKNKYNYCSLFDDI